MADPKKVANNILDFLIDPTKIPVKKRVYFRPEENLKNDVYENAKADAAKAYKNQRSNSDFYPNKNRHITQREALMDRKSLIASFDILSKNFSENDPIGKDLRTMAAAVSKMSDGEFSSRQASNAPNFDGMQVEAKDKAKTFPCPTCGTKVLEAAGYCVKCKKKVKPGKKAAEEDPKAEEPKDEEPAKKEEPTEKEPEEKKEEDVEASDFWTKEAMTRVARALVSDVLGMSQEDEEAPGKKVEEPKKEEEIEAKKAPKEELAPKEEEVEAKKTPKEEVEDENKKAAVVPEEDEKVVEKELPVKEEKKSTVNTDILATITFGDITMDAPIVDAGEMTEEEKARLAGLFN